VVFFFVRSLALSWRRNAAGWPVVSHSALGEGGGRLGIHPTPLPFDPCDAANRAFGRGCWQTERDSSRVLPFFSFLRVLYVSNKKKPLSPATQPRRQTTTTLTHQPLRSPPTSHSVGRSDICWPCHCMPFSWSVCGVRFMASKVFVRESSPKLIETGRSGEAEFPPPPSFIGMTTASIHPSLSRRRAQRNTLAKSTAQKPAFGRAWAGGGGAGGGGD
jgi:hypothetical protein